MNSAGPRCDAKQKRKTLEEENEQMFKTQFRNEAHRPYDGSNYASCMLHAAFAAESETRTNTESFQLLTYSEDSASMGSGWTWEITLRIRSISLSATECMVFNPMETVYSCIKNPVCTNDLGVYNYENTAVRYDIYASRGNANYSGGEQPAIVWNLGEINPGDVITMKFRIDIQDYYYANFQLLNQFLDEGGRLFTTTGTDEGPRFVYNENGEQGTAESMCRRRMFPAVLFLNITTL